MQAVFAAHDLFAEAGRGVAPLLDGLMLVVASSAIVGRAQACHRAWAARSIGGRSGIGGGNSTVGDQVASEAIHPEDALRIAGQHPRTLVEQENWSGCMAGKTFFIAEVMAELLHFRILVGEGVV
jgi:hypothetical protein